MEKKHKTIICGIVAILLNLGMMVSLDIQPTWMSHSIVRILFMAFVFLFVWYVMFPNNTEKKPE